MRVIRSLLYRSLIVGAMALSGLVASGRAAEPESDIVGGVVDTEHPAVGYLRLGDSFACSGLLIGPSCVLTAAHCLDGISTEEIQFLLGENIAAPDFRVNVRRSTIDPSYSGGVGERDFAVLELVSAVSTTPLAATSAAGATTARLVGFGANASGGTGIGIRRHADVAVLGVSTLTVTTDGDTSNACGGDSGGAVLRFESGVWKAIGVISATGTNCADFAFSSRIDNALNNFILPAAAGCTATQVGSGIFLDGFESEDTGAWSDTEP